MNRDLPVSSKTSLAPRDKLVFIPHGERQHSQSVKRTGASPTQVSQENDKDRYQRLMDAATSWQKSIQKMDSELQKVNRREKVLNLSFQCVDTAKRRKLLLNLKNRKKVSFAGESSSKRYKEKSSWQKDRPKELN